jgi:hypothetical protein
MTQYTDKRPESCNSVEYMGCALVMIRTLCIAGTQGCFNGIRLLQYLTEDENDSDNDS